MAFVVLVKSDRLLIKELGGTFHRIALRCK